MSPCDSVTPTASERAACHDDQTDFPTTAQLRALWPPVILFVVISIADTISSVLMLEKGVMEEYNPVMRFVWDLGGSGAFVAVKTMLVLIPLAIFNALKRQHYWLVRRALWLTILGYCSIYGILFYIANY